MRLYFFDTRKLITVAAGVAAFPSVGIVATVADSDRANRAAVAVDPQSDRAAVAVDPQSDKVADRAGTA